MISFFIEVEYIQGLECVCFRDLVKLFHLNGGQDKKLTTKEQRSQVPSVTVII